MADLFVFPFLYIKHNFMLCMRLPRIASWVILMNYHNIYLFEVINCMGIPFHYLPFVLQVLCHGQKIITKMESTLKRKNLLLEEQTLSFKSWLPLRREAKWKLQSCSPHLPWEGRQNENGRVAPPESIFIHVKNFPKYLPLRLTPTILNLYGKLQYL